MKKLFLVLSLLVIGMFLVSCASKGDAVAGEAIKTKFVEKCTPIAATSCTTGIKCPDRTIIPALCPYGCVPGTRNCCKISFPKVTRFSCDGTFNISMVNTNCGFKENKRFDCSKIRNPNNPDFRMTCAVLNANERGECYECGNIICVNNTGGKYISRQGNCEYRYRGQGRPSLDANGNLQVITGAGC